jgi:group I intron endonuclease
MHTCPNGKRYVGITSIDPERRWSKGSGYSHQVFFNAVKKYGWENIKHEILNVVETVEEAVDLEARYIAKYNTTSRFHGYNIAPNAIACGGIPKSRHSDATKRKMSEAAKRRPPRVYTAEQLERMRQYLRAKNPHAPKKWTTSGFIRFRRHKGTPIVQFDERFNPICIWETVAQAQRSTSINPYPSLYKKGTKSGGFFWKKLSSLSQESYFDFFEKKVPVHLLTGETLPINLCED